MIWDENVILEIKNYMTEMETVQNELLESLHTFESMIKGDENFTSFRNGTPIGLRLADEVDTIIEVTSGTCENTKDVINMTNTVLEEQEINNRATVNSVGTN